MVEFPRPSPCRRPCEVYTLLTRHRRNQNRKIGYDAGMGVELLTERYKDQIAGVLSCYGQIIIQGTVPGWCYAGGMTKYLAMELGYEGVLLNTAIAAAEDSVRMATAMRLGVEAGRHAYLAGRMEKKLYASASSPMAGVVR